MRLNKLVIFALLVIVGCSTKPNNSINETVAKPKPYYVPVNITKTSAIQSPCVDVEIDGMQFSMELDLGFRGDLTIGEESLDLISTKSFLFEKSMHGVRGKQYPTKTYRVPKAKIGKMTFFKPALQTHSSEFEKDSVFTQDGKEPSPSEAGRIGWELFYNVNLLISMKDRRIAFSDSLEMLQKQGYKIDNFTKTPLFLDRGLVEIEANGPEGVLRCVLDTGATWNILNREIEGEKSLDVAVWDPENQIEYAHFKIEEHEFGPLTFHRMPIKLPFHIDAILGMEFFEENIVFLDFSNGCAYFSKCRDIAPCEILR